MLHVIPTKKFKDIGISIRFQNTLDQKEASKRSLLALLLCDRCFAYDTKQKMKSHLDYLYGATLHAQTLGYGNAHVVELQMKIMNPSYAVDGADLMEEVFTFLHEVLFCPLIREDVCKEAKMILQAQIKRNEDDPAQFAISQGLKCAGKGTPLAISSLGESAQVASLCQEEIVQAYEDMLHNDVIDIILCGDVEKSTIAQMVTTYFPFQPRKTVVDTYYAVQSDRDDEQIIAHRNISQTSVMMVWFTNTRIIDPAYYALSVACAMFGQYPTSFLFQEVREKHNLCYSIYSNLISFDSVMGVTTGIEKENTETTIALIQKQFDRIKTGDFDDALLNVSKQMMINSLTSGDDSMGNLIALQYQNRLLQRHDTSQDISARIAAVTRDDIVKVMAQVERKMTYILTQGGEDCEKSSK